MPAQPHLIDTALPARRMVLLGSGLAWLCIRAAASAPGLLRVGVEGALPPFNYQDEAGRLQGFEIDLMRELALRIGQPVRFVAMPWPSLPGALRAGRIDLVIDHIVPTPERSRMLAFSHPYAQTGLVLLIRSQSIGAIHDVDSLAGLRVGAAIGSYYEQWLSIHQPRATVILHPSLELGIIELEFSRIDAIIVDEVVAEEVARHHLAVHAIALPTAALVEAIALRHGSTTLLRKLNAAIDAMRADGSLALLSLLWFGRDIGPHC